MAPAIRLITTLSVIASFTLCLLPSGTVVLISRIAGAMANQPFYIADGHHRYTSALTYRREKVAATPGISSDDAINFVMSTLVDFTDPGLIILAPHRLIRGLFKTVLTELVTNLGAFFEITELPANTRVAWQKLDAEMAKPNISDSAIRLRYR